MVRAMPRGVHLLYSMVAIKGDDAPLRCLPDQRPKRRRCPVCLTAVTSACTAGSAERK